jgi:hypothetical protein
MVNKDEFEATINFKLDMIFYAQKNWPGIAGKLNKILKLNPKLPEDNLASFAFFLAVLFVQYRAPYNIFSKEQGERIWKYLKNSFSAEPQFGSYANESLDLYSSVWNQYIEKGLNPLFGVASALLYNLGYEEKNTDFFLGGTILSDCIALSPPWWKNFFEKYKLVKSDIPLDLENFMQFTGEINENKS